MADGEIAAGPERQGDVALDAVGIDPALPRLGDIPLLT